MLDIFRYYPVLLWPLGPIVLVWALVSLHRINSGAARWPRTTAIVICREMQKHSARVYGQMYWPTIQIRYTVQGCAYRATFQWDAGISYDDAQETLNRFIDQGVIGIQYAPFDPSIVRIRPGKLNSETSVKYMTWGGVGVLFSALTVLAAFGG